MGNHSDSADLRQGHHGGSSHKRLNNRSLLYDQSPLALIFSRSKVKVPRETATAPKMNPLFLEQHFLNMSLQSKYLLSYFPNRQIDKRRLSQTQGNWDILLERLTSKWVRTILISGPPRRLLDKAGEGSTFSEMRQLATWILWSLKSAALLILTEKKDRKVRKNLAVIP